MLRRQKRLIEILNLRIPKTREWWIQIWPLSWVRWFSCMAEAFLSPSHSFPGGWSLPFVPLGSPLVLSESRPSLTRLPPSLCDGCNWTSFLKLCTMKAHRKKLMLGVGFYNSLSRPLVLGGWASMLKKSCIKNICSQEQACHAWGYTDWFKTILLVLASPLKCVPATTVPVHL